LKKIDEDGSTERQRERRRGAESDGEAASRGQSEKDRAEPGQTEMKMAMTRRGIEEDR